MHQENNCCFGIYQYHSYKRGYTYLPISPYNKKAVLSLNRNANNVLLHQIQPDRTLKLFKRWTLLILRPIGRSTTMLHNSNCITCRNSPTGIRTQANSFRGKTVLETAVLTATLWGISINLQSPKIILTKSTDLRHTNCLIFAHIRPVRRHGLSHR